MLTLLTFATQIRLMEVWCRAWLPRPRADIIDFYEKGRAP